MSITALDDGGVGRQVTKIAGRKVTLDTGASIGWNFDATATLDGRVAFEETAGNIVGAGIVIDVENTVNLTVYTIVDAGDTNWVAEGATELNPNAIVSGSEYIITNVGGVTDFTLIGASANTVGVRFIATSTTAADATDKVISTTYTSNGTGAAGTGTVTEGTFVDETTHANR